MDKIFEALAKLLPEAQAKEIAEAVRVQMESEVKAIDAKKEAEYSTKLDEAYSELSDELKKSETTALQGYQEAHAIIQSLMQKLETQQAEFKSEMDGGYEEAYQMLQAEKAKNENIEVDMYNQFDKKLQEMKEYMVDKLDQFLQFKGQEIYENARRDIMNDPRMVEHKVALDKIVRTVSDYISDEDYAAVSNEKLDSASKAIEDLKSQNRILEARNIRLNTENTKLNESVRRQDATITEATSHKTKELEKKAQNVTGRGRVVSEATEIVAEFAKPSDKAKAPVDNTVVEGFDPAMLHLYNVLAGTKEND